MKATTLRNLAAAAALVALAACGGKATYDINVTVGGLTNTGLVITNTSNGDTLEIAPGTQYTKFNKAIEYGDSYAIALTSNPAQQTCSVSGATGSAGLLASISVGVSCAQNSYTIGGTVNGLAEGKVLRLANGSAGGTVDLIGTSGAPALNFTMPANVAQGSAYGVAVLIQPDKQTCNVENGSGIMTDYPRTNIIVKCVATP